jgi:hypothetical protein
MILGFKQTKHKTFCLTIAISLVASFAAAPAFAWKIEKSQGSVSIETKGKSAPAAAGAELTEGQTVVTGADGRALIKDGESEVWLGSGSRFLLQAVADADADKEGRLDLLAGRLRAKFKKPLGPSEFPYKVRVKTVVAGVRGTEFFVAIDGSEEKICTLEGLVRVSSIKGAEFWDVPKGKGLFVKPKEMPKVRETTDAQSKQWVEQTTF